MVVEGIAYEFFGKAKSGFQNSIFPICYDFWNIVSVLWAYYFVCFIDSSLFGDEPTRGVSARPLGRKF